MEQYKEFKNCKFKLTEKVRIVSRDKMKELETSHNEYVHMYGISSKCGTIVDKLSSGYLLQLDDDRLNEYGAFNTKHLGKKRIFGNIIKEKFLVPYNKNKRLI